jgi:hypothetical protein
MSTVYVETQITNPAWTVNGINKEFILDHTPDIWNVIAFVDGAFDICSVDLATNTITTTTAPVAAITIRYTAQVATPFSSSGLTLIQVRQKVRELSGRFDLVSSTYADLGVDFFINEGRKYLDRLDSNNKSYADWFTLIAIGGFSTSIPLCRAIKEVWVATAAVRWQLEKKSVQDLITGYLTGLPSSRTNGSPSYYAPTVSRYIPEDAAVGAINAFSGFVDLPAGNAHEYSTILLNCPTSEQLMIDVKGLFYSKELVEDTDKNYWSEAHPMLLVQAAMRQIEISNRNTQGKNDWEAVIKEEVAQIGMDLVEEDIAEVDCMEG